MLPSFNDDAFSIARWFFRRQCGVCTSNVLDSLTNNSLPVHIAYSAITKSYGESCAESNGSCQEESPSVLPKSEVNVQTHVNLAPCMLIVIYEK